MTESDKFFQPRERRGNFLMNKKQSIQFLVAGIMTVLSTSWVSAASGSETDSVSDQKVFELAGVTVEAKRPDWESKLSPGTVTVIETKKFQGEQKDLADILKSVPGVHVRELNGKGQYTVATVRGSTAAQVGVFVDGVMTNLGGDAAVDISTIPIKNVERVEVYRGYIPARFGGTFIGGVINVVTKKPAKAHISAELGKASFGGKSASVEVVAPMKSGSLLFGVNYEKCKGDFPYENLYVKAFKNNHEGYVFSSHQEIESDIENHENDLARYKKEIDEHENNLQNFDKYYLNDNINYGIDDDILSGELKPYYDTDSRKIKDFDGFNSFVREGGLKKAILNRIENEYKDKLNEINTSGDIDWSSDSDNYKNDTLFNEKDKYYKIANKALEWYKKNNNEDNYEDIVNDIKSLEGSKEEIWNNFKEYAKENDIKETEDEFKEWLNGQKHQLSQDVYSALSNDLANDTGYIKVYPEIKKEMLKPQKDALDKEYEKKRNDGEHTANRLDLQSSDAKELLNDEKTDYKKKLNDIKKDQKKAKIELAGLYDAERHRMDNDRKNISTIIKWQNARWMVKGSYQYLNRHLPERIDPYDDYADLYRGTLGVKRQTLKTLDLMVQNRNQNGNLEWGWFIDYQKQKKHFQREDYDKSEDALYASLFRALFGQWSEFDSKKYNIQIDGTYKLSDRQMLDFQANYSHERMDIDGNGMSDILKKFGKSEYAGFDWYDKSSAFQVRNAMEQNILNLQLQDTITLDKKGTWFLTPALRYNQSKLIGRSESPNFYDKPGGWSASFPLNPVDTQIDGKGTWQLALKKVVNDNLTFRMAGGTYYRLLNLYEIMGDGCSITPMPGVNFEKLKKNRDLRDQAIKEGRDPKTIIVEDAAEFAHPESGSQFELSTLWQGKMKHGTAHANLTYFWRTIDNMLTLGRTTYYGWSYRNNVSGKAHGFELQTGLSGKHLSLDLELTYLHGKGTEKIIEPGFNGRKILGTYSFPIPYQPEWEGNLRLSWFPNKKVTMFGEIHFQTNYITERSNSVDGISTIRTDEGKEISFETYAPFATIDSAGLFTVFSCAIINVGIKLQPSKVLSMAFGVNDLLDQNSGHWKGSDDYGGCIEYPLPGRNYYATIRYAF